MALFTQASGDIATGFLVVFNHQDFHGLPAVNNRRRMMPRR
jgi:hypothetical protein